MSLCESIDTVSMMFLDDELAAEERRELELHLLDCASCRQHVDHQRAELDMVRKALVPPLAPALLKARIARALDAEDAIALRSERRRWSQWMLPGSAMLAAAAAIVVFVGVGASSSPTHPVVNDARKQNRSLPLEVQGASTEPWVRDHFPPIEPPRFTEPGIALRGARLLPNGIANHDAVMLRYEIGDSRVALAAFVLKDLRADEFGGGDAYQVGKLILRLHEGRAPVVTYVDRRDNVGYVFVTDQLTAYELLRLVGSTDLIARAQQRR
jgi:anti-sigma factor RsiW